MLLLLIAGTAGAGMLWPLFARTKDPRVAVSWANLAGCAIFVALCVIYRRRLSRLHVLDALLAFSLGALSSVAGMAWAVANGYPR